MAIIWPEPDRHLPKLTGFGWILNRIDIISSAVLSNTGGGGGVSPSCCQLHSTKMAKLTIKLLTRTDKKCKSF